MCVRMKTNVKMHSCASFLTSFSALPLIGNTNAETVCLIASFLDPLLQACYETTPGER